MNKVVILVGSVRKGGNTSLLAQAFAEGAKANNEVEIISVADYKVNPCIRCESCKKNEGNRCFQKDDMQKIYPKLAEADLIVIASPVYFYGVSAQLKAVIDRLHTPLRNTFKVKRLALLLVAGAELPTVFDSILHRYQQILSFFHLEDAGMILVRGVRAKGAIAGNKALNDARNLGAHI